MALLIPADGLGRVRRRDVVRSPWLPLRDVADGRGLRYRLVEPLASTLTSQDEDYAAAAALHRPYRHPGVVDTVRNAVYRAFVEPRAFLDPLTLAVTALRRDGELP